MMSISTKTKLDIVHASHWFGGLQIPTCWDIQGSQHLHLLPGHIQLYNLFGKHLITSINYTYHILGLESKVFTYDFRIVKDYIPMSWIANTWSHVSLLPGIIIT